MFELSVQPKVIEFAVMFEVVGLLGGVGVTALAAAVLADVVV